MTDCHRHEARRRDWQPPFPCVAVTYRAHVKGLRLKYTKSSESAGSTSRIQHAEGLCNSSPHSRLPRKADSQKLAVTCSRTSPVALMRRGCVTTMLQAPPPPDATASSSRNCGTCVDLPHPARRSAARGSQLCLTSCGCSPRRDPEVLWHGWAQCTTTPKQHHSEPNHVAQARVLMK